MTKSKEENYEAIASQIGDMGGEPQAGLGKLTHKRSYGQKEDLTPEEEASKEAFLKRQKRALSDSADGGLPNIILDTESPISEGWIPLSINDFGIRGQFYPSNWEFYIRPATVMAMKNWVGVDEKNALQLNKVFDEIVKQCVKIKTTSGQTVPWSHINTWDRFWLILKVRELTFASNKKTITFEDSCTECDQEITFELRSDTLHYEFPDADIVKKHWNPDEMCWDIDLTEYGVDDHEPVTLYTPTLSKQQAIIDWAQRMYNRGKKVDENFASVYLPWLLDRVPKDEVQFDKMVSKIEKEYKGWSVACFELMTDIIRNITINPKETLKQTCPHCGEEVVSNVQFPNGVKILFQAETRVQKFGSR